MRRGRGLGAVAGTLVLGTFGMAGPTSAARPAATEASVFFVQMAPQDLELYVDGADIGGFPGRTQANFQFFETLVPAGTHNFQVFPAGTGPTSGTPVATTTATLGPGSDYTLVSYLDPSGTPQLGVLPFDTEATAAGSARLVIRNTADSSPVDVYVNGTKVASGLPDDPSAPVTADIAVPAGTTAVQVTAGGDPTTVLATQTLPLAPAEVADLEVTGAAGSGAPSIGIQGLYEYLPTGYWEATRDGGVYAEGTAPFLGSLGGRRLVSPVVGVTATPSGRGYWLAASDGGVFTFGDAGFFGSLGSIHLAAPIVGMAASPDGAGYWLVASDGGVFTFGDAGFFGSAGAEHLAAPVSGMAATLDGGGYWLVARDGGVFAYGDADWLGSAGGLPLAAPVVGMSASDDGHGYHLVGADGGVLDYGNGSFGGVPGPALTAPVVGVAAP